MQLEFISEGVCGGVSSRGASVLALEKRSGGSPSGKVWQPEISNG